MDGARATNHRDLLPHIRDGRQTQALRFRDLVRTAKVMT
jgi:hypothetical protein